MKYAILTIVLLMIFAFPQKTYAQTPTAASEPTLETTVKVSVVPGVGASASAWTSETARMREILFKRIEAAVLRVERIYQRLASRSDKIKSSSTSTSRRKTLLTNLQKKIDQLKNDMVIAQNLAQVFSVSNNVTVDGTRLRQQLQTVIKELTEAFALEKSLVLELKKYSPAILPTKSVASPSGNLEGGR